MTGHLFIINGDLNKVDCDALLIPTDSRFKVEDKWTVAPKDLVDRERARGWGERSVCHLTEDDAHRQIWLGNVGMPGKGWSFEAFAPKIETFVSAAVDQAKAAEPSDRRRDKIRLAVNLVGSGKGGGSDRKGELLKGQIRLLQSLATEHEVDLVLVTYGEKPYAAAQRARRDLVAGKLEAAWAFDKDANPNLIDAAQYLADQAVANQLVLFIGAGVSAGAGLPTWNELISRMALEAGIAGQLLTRLMGKDLRDAATIIEQRLAAKHPTFTSDGGYLRHEIAEKLGGTSVYTLAHGLLASLPSSEAVTTNYDLLFEEASAIDKRKLAVLPANPRKSDGRWLLKLHGSVSDPKSIVLTRSDYLNMPRRYGALMGLVQGLLMMRHLMFVGYSLRDEDFHELVEEVRNARGIHGGGIDGGTVLTLFSDDLDRQLWLNDLRMVPMMNCEPPESHSHEKADLEKAAARQLDMFLDLLGFKAATSSAFFLDSDYVYLLSDDEVQLRELLLQVFDRTSHSTGSAVAYKLRTILESEFGAEALSPDPASDSGG